MQIRSSRTVPGLGEPFRMLNDRGPTGLFAAVVMAITLAMADTSNAQAASQPADDPFAGVEEMVVVGSEMVGSLTTTSTAVTSFDAASLDALGVANVSDVAAYTPNLEIRTASATTATFFIRGVGLNDFTSNAASAVSVYVDEAPRNLPAIQLGLLYDLKGIEVAKGPQGSGPGRNASAGAIRMFTKKPTGEAGGYARFDYGNFGLLDGEGALEVPIVEDMLAVRTAFRILKREGIVNNRCAGFTAAEVNAVGRPALCGEADLGPLVQEIRPGLEKNLNNQDSWSTRTSLRFVPPIEGMEWNLVGHVDRTDQLGAIGQHLGAIATLGSVDVGGYRQREIDEELAQITSRFNIPTPAQCRRRPDPAACLQEIDSTRAQINGILAKNMAKRPLDRLPFDGDYNNPGFERQTGAGFNLSGEWELDSLTAKSITAFETYDRERYIDADYSPNTLFEFDIEDRATQISQDLRMSGELESLPLRWDTGAFYLQEKLKYGQQTISQFAQVTNLIQRYVQDTKSMGVYLDLSLDLLDDLTLDAGVRYNWEQKSFNALIFSGAGASASPQCVVDPGTGTRPPCHRTDTVDHPTGRLGLTYQFDELREAYLKYSHGWKGLQYNARDGITKTLVTDVADPEVIDALELGFKGSWFEEFVNVEGALFWYGYQNYQVFTFTNDSFAPPVRIVRNANSAQNFGAELATIFRPIENLVADVRFGWLETRFLDFTDTVARPVPGTTGQIFRQVFDFNGNQLPNAPRFKVSASIEYGFDLNRIGRITPRYDLAWTDDVNFDQSGGRGSPNITGAIFMPENTIGQRQFMLHNIRISYLTPSERIEFTTWVRNLTNEVYKTLAFNASGGPGIVGSLVGDPRTYGVSLKLTF